MCFQLCVFILPFQVSKKQKKEQQRLEKKKRQEERHRQKVLANKSNCADSNRRETDSNNQVTLVKAMEALNIWLNGFWVLWWEKQIKLVKAKLPLSKFPVAHCYLKICFCTELQAHTNFLFLQLQGEQLFGNSASTCVWEELFVLHKK